MKRIHALALFLFVFAGVVFAGWYGCEFVNIEVKPAGYSLDIPSFWVIDQAAIDETGELNPTIDMGESEYFMCYITKLTGKYTAAKKDIVKFFRKEVFGESDAKLLPIKIQKKYQCKKVNGIEVCSAVLDYDGMTGGPERSYFAVFKTKKGAYKIVFASSPETFDTYFPAFEEMVVGSLKLIK